MVYPFWVYLYDTADDTIPGLGARSVGFAECMGARLCRVICPSFRLYKSSSHTIAVLFTCICRAGHCVFELCTSEQTGSAADVADSGQITRLTIPKSVGKEAWVDCKSRSWGKTKSEGPFFPSSHPPCTGCKSSPPGPGLPG